MKTVPHKLLAGLWFPLRSRWQHGSPHRSRSPLLLALACALLLAAAPSAGQQPELVQEQAQEQAQELSQDHVNARAAQVYAGRIAQLERSHQLDSSARFSTRIQAIAAQLIAQARQDYPYSRDWAWEVHTSTNPDDNGDSMAGGKILLSLSHVESLELSDAELAMLLAHEIAHAALRHNWFEYQQALRLAPGYAQRPFLALEDAVDNDPDLMARLAPLNFAQEAEADRAGLILAWRAGWPADRVAGYFKKLMRASGRPNFDSAAYPSPASRWRAAQLLAEKLAH